MNSIHREGKKTPADVAGKLRDQEVPWNDIRGRRVLTELEQARKASKNRRPRGRVFALAAALTLGIGAVLFWGLQQSEMATEPVEIIQAQNMLEGETILSLAEAGRAILYQGAKVEVVEQNKEELSLSQTDGKVRYEIEHIDDHKTEVHALDVTVRVIGTKFYVEVEEDEVRVVVEEGVVEVLNHQQVVKLRAGGEVSVLRGAGEKIIRESDTEDENTEEEIEKDTADKRLPRARPSTIERTEETATSSRNPPIPKDEVKEVLVVIDDARRTGRLGEAASLLRELIEKNPADPRTTSALFNLGDVERSLGNHTAAAKAYSRCWKRMPQGSLAEDARAEEADSWKRAGIVNRAKNAANEYLEKHPNGIHRVRMEQLTK